MPENFPVSLFGNYRQYGLDNEDKEEISNFEFFVDNILYMVNCRVTKWRTHGSKELLSQCFTVSDEAFGLLMAENYVEIWEKQLNENDKLKWRKEIGEPKYSSSNRGQRCSDEMSWKTEGIRRYYELCHMVSERRKSEQGGKALEEFILEKGCPKRPTYKEEQMPVEDVIEEYHGEGYQALFS